MIRSPILCAGTVHVFVPVAVPTSEIGEVMAARKACQHPSGL